MAWIDFSSTESNDWTEGPSDTVFTMMEADSTNYGQNISCTVTSDTWEPVPLVNFEPVPGQENANLVAVSPVQGDLVAEGSGGGSARPSNGFLYPRGQG